MNALSVVGLTAAGALIGYIIGRAVKERQYRRRYGYTRRRVERRGS
jgi:membrane protein YqaA with SNARE-associated domain